MEVAASIVKVVGTIVKVVGTIVKVAGTIAKVADTIVEVVGTIGIVLGTTVEVAGTIVGVAGTIVEVVGTSVKAMGTLSRMLWRGWVASSPLPNIRDGQFKNKHLYDMRMDNLKTSTCMSGVRAVDEGCCTTSRPLPTPQWTMLCLPNSAQRN